MEHPDGMTPPEAAQMPPEGWNPSQGKGNHPEGQKPEEGTTGDMPGIPGGFGGPNGFKKGDFNMGGNAELSTEFVIVDGGNYFTNVSPAQ
jgi:hypothetical protein